MIIPVPVYELDCMRKALNFIHYFSPLWIVCIHSIVLSPAAELNELWQ